ncbi:MAG: hypothetical protein FWE16_05670 [Firmicutes bacterium]|nr:hypothetical protein [Bacillota bacterium]
MKRFRVPSFGTLPGYFIYSFILTLLVIVVIEISNQNIWIILPSTVAAFLTINFIWSFLSKRKIDNEGGWHNEK